MNIRRKKKNLSIGASKIKIIKSCENKIMAEAEHHL